MRTRWDETAAMIAKKPALKAWYEQCYNACKTAMDKAPAGPRLELGSPSSIGKAYIPGLITSNLHKLPEIDRVVDAKAMPFTDGEIAGICMMNVLHHLGAVEQSFREMSRVLMPGGRLLIIDQYPGFPAQAIYQFVHDEPFDLTATSWNTAEDKQHTNGAIAWLIFFRDRKRFEAHYPGLSIERIAYHSPLLYWLSGGLKRWTLLPGKSYKLAMWLDKLLLTLWSGFASFVEIELVKH